MKRILIHLTALVFVVIFIAGAAPGAAAPTDNLDIDGHWAEETMRRAQRDLLIAADGSNLMPDAAMTRGALLTILCQVLSPGISADLTDVTDITEDDPYYETAAQSVALGLVTPVDGRLYFDRPVTRGSAFSMLTEAFGLTAATADGSDLTSFTDGRTVTGEYRAAAAALISGGYIQGFGGALHLDRDITRAEFLTVFYNLVPNYSSTPLTGSGVSGGAIFAEDTYLDNMQADDNLYFDGTARTIRLRNVTAPAVVLRSDNAPTLSFSLCDIDRLVFANAAGDVSFSPDYTTTVDTAVVSTGSGKMTFGGNTNNVEVTGSGRNVTINTSIKSLVVSGSGNIISVGPGAHIDTLKILGTGSGNKIVLNGTCSECLILGADTEITGIGRIQQLRDYAKNSAITAAIDQEDVNKNYGLNGVEITLTGPEDEVAAYALLKATASVTPATGDVDSRGAWYLDGVYLSAATVSLEEAATIALETDVADRGTAPATRTLTFVLSGVTPEGYYQEIKAEQRVTLRSPTKFDAQEILDLVTTGYAGDYTLEWALENDYDYTVKTEWVNLKGYSSKTDYLVWINITHQRVNIFKGSAGSWTLDRSFIVGTGADGTDTPVGVYSVIGRSTRGWNTKAYTVKPVIFFINYAYGFHSRLYYPGTTTIKDPGIGYPISHGCIRMYDEDVAWFYDYIPTRTTVVVY